MATSNLICPECGNGFYAEPGRIRRTKAAVMYCSQACRKLATAKRRQEARKIPKKFRIAPNCTCPVCGIAFYAEPGRTRLAKGGQVFCSIKCRSLALLPHNKDKGGVILHCETCGREFRVRPNRLSRNARYCSHRCEAAAHSAEAVKRNTRTCAHCGRSFARDATSLRKTAAITGGKVYCSSVCSYAATRSRGKNKFETDFHASFPQLVYTGDGTWVLHDDLGGMNPDFILPNTNLVIETWGNYWHGDDDPNLRINRLNALGFQCLIVWEDDFRKHTTETLELVRNFLSGCSVHSL